MKRKPLATTRDGLTMTLAPFTKTKIDRLASYTGLSRGRIVDAAIEAVGVCSSCDGTGRIEPSKARCGRCSGNGIATS